MNLPTLLLIVLTAILIGALPISGLGHNWVYVPSGALGAVLLVVVMLQLTERF